MTGFWQDVPHANNDKAIIGVKDAILSPARPTEVQGVVKPVQDKTRCQVKKGRQSPGILAGFVYKCLEDQDAGSGQL